MSRYGSLVLVGGTILTGVFDGCAIESMSRVALLVVLVALPLMVLVAVGLVEASGEVAR